MDNRTYESYWRQYTIDHPEARVAARRKYYTTNRERINADRRLATILIREMRKVRVTLPGSV